jgi:hypothetical protein
MGDNADLERERFAVAALRSVELRAPAGLRTRIEAERERAQRPARRRRFGLGSALAGATAAAAVLVALLLPGGAGGPTVVEAAELATRAPEAPAPQAGEAKLLATSAFGLPFPDWAEKFGWVASGRRVDELDGRRAVTVFYEKDGREIAYTIISGEALPAPEPSAEATREGTRLRYLTDDGRTIVTWERNGLTCVLSGPDVPATTLLNLAGWKGLGAVPF